MLANSEAGPVASVVIVTAVEGGLKRLALHVLPGALSHIKLSRRDTSGESLAAVAKDTSDINDALVSVLTLNGADSLEVKAMLGEFQDLRKKLWDVMHAR